MRQNQIKLLLYRDSTLRLKCDGTRAETIFRLSAKRTGPLKSAEASVQSTTGSRGVRISGRNAGYTMFQGSVKSTGYVIYDFPSERHFVHYRSRTVCPRGENSATVLNTLRTGDADLRF